MPAIGKMCVCLVLLTLVAVSGPGIDSRAAASELNLKPNIGLTVGHDDNILFQRGDTISDSFYTVSPEIKLDRKTEVSSLNTIIHYDAIRHFDESDFDSDNYSVSLSGEYKGRQRWTTTADLSYDKDTTLDTYLEETGRIVQREDQELFQAGGSVAYLFSEISSVALGYKFTKYDYDTPSFDDSESHRVYLSYFHRLKNEIDTLSIVPAYYTRRIDSEKVDDVSLSLGWSRSLTETFYAKAQLGGRYTTVEKTSGVEDDAFGVTALFELRHKNEVSNTTIRYFHDLRTTADGREITADNLYLRYRRLFSERFGIGAIGRFVLSDKVSGIDEAEEISKSLLYQVQPFIFYSITENSSVTLAYQYQYNYDDALTTDESVDRNRVWIEFRIGWPIVM